ncbi:hypothetical protein VMCG_05256 [Cytospora schulzeri]|uniref:Uncharacterized protein n=1 Tax=Cytospora schulzeri TaxID=448051 RepID=A0A423WQH6_9PEZI|nr:hypothetical protein VMCG_05256 [Valsa malicola]
MRGNTVCDTWARVPGLSSYWCLQLQWRIDEDVVAALTEPRYPVPDEDLDTIILTQTIYLLQLFLHLHEFDPCLKDGDPDDDLLRLFQDILGREFNTVYYYAGGDTTTSSSSPTAPARRIHQGPCPDGEALERVVRGLMIAQKEGSEQQQQQQQQQQSQSQPPSQAQQQQQQQQSEQSRSPQPLATTTTAPAPGAISSSPGGSSSTTTTTTTTTASPDPTKAGLQHLVVQLLAELNRPLYKQRSRYEEAHGPRTDETWAARLATRVVQWRYHMRNPVIRPALRSQVIRVSEDDVHALDGEGLEVYRLLRNMAPGFIHVATPLQPELQMPTARIMLPGGAGAGRSASGGIKMQHILASPIPQTPDHTPTVSSNTPRTPLFPQPPGGGGGGGDTGERRGGDGEGGNSAAGPYGDGGVAANKRASAQNLSYPPAKRPRSANRYEAERYEGEYRRPKRERQPLPLPLPLAPPPPQPPVAAAGGEIPIRGSGGEDSATGPAAATAVVDDGTMATAKMTTTTTNYQQQHQQQQQQLGPEEEDTDLLRRILDGVNGLHQRMHGMHRDLGRRFNALENRLQRLEEWITDPV